MGFLSTADRECPWQFNFIHECQGFFNICLPRWMFVFICRFEFSRHFDCFMHPYGMIRHYIRQDVYGEPLSKCAPWRR